MGFTGIEWDLMGFNGILMRGVWIFLWYLIGGLM